MGFSGIRWLWRRAAEAVPGVASGIWKCFLEFPWKFCTLFNMRGCERYPSVKWLWRQAAEAVPRLPQVSRNAFKNFRPNFMHCLIRGVVSGILA